MNRHPSPPIGTPSAAVAALFAGTVTALEAPPRLVDERLLPDERRHVAAAVDGRRAEFGTARVIAREALERLGVAPGPLVPNDDRSPRWPAGVAGTISHTDDRCIVVVSDAPDIAALGVDVERIDAVRMTLLPMIGTARELSRLDGLPPHRRTARAALLFSAKEAVYKCQYPLTGRVLEFADMEIDVDDTAGEFRVASVRGLERADSVRVRALRGRFLTTKRHVVTGATLMHGRPRSL